ncbi:MAG: hypothetical protein LN566_03080 [Rickettsia endosymbiont of Stiretrus anchorago]|nr:hypothetical protein [Rickettsia endosymbiont of Stiretrus anchorago]
MAFEKLGNYQEAIKNYDLAIQYRYSKIIYKLEVM